LQPVPGYFIELTHAALVIFIAQLGSVKMPGKWRNLEVRKFGLILEKKPVG
jgi:hypothetical protein